MSNNTYRSVHFKSVSEKKLRQKIQGEALVLGVDVAKEKCQTGLGTPDGQIHRVIEWRHPFETRELIDFVNRLEPAQVEVVMEPTSTYHEPLRYQASQEGWDVFCMAPKRMHDAAEVYDGVPSQHDTKACHLLIWLNSEGMSEPWSSGESTRRRLKVLTDRLATLELEFQRCEGRLEARLGEYWPEISCGWDPVSATMLGVLKEFGGPREVANRSGEVAQRMKEIGGPFLSESRIQQVMDWAKSTVARPMLKEERTLLEQLADDTDRIRRQQAQLKRKLGRMIHKKKTFEEIRMLSEEVGNATAAVFRVHVGDFREYRSPQALLKGFGLNLKEKSSGESQGRLSITKRGSSSARRFLYLATLRKIKRDPVFEAWHEQKVQRDGEVKLKSIIALMRKYVQGLWHVSRGREFDSRKLFDVSRLQVA